MGERVIRSFLAGAVGLMVFCSCAHIPKEARLPPAVIPEAYEMRVEGRASTNYWWTSFGDTGLNAIIEEALAGNPGLKQAAARLEQAEALARKAGAARIPQVNAGGSAARGRATAFDMRGNKVSRTSNRFGLNLAASYEIDLWGRVGAIERAAAIDAQASMDDLETAAMTLVARVVETWYYLASLNEQLELLEAQIGSNEKVVHLIELRFKTGQATALDVWQQRGQLAALQTFQPGIESMLVTKRHQLAVLLGRNPQNVADLKPASIPDLPPKPEMGVPADLLENRPDVRSAIERVRAADERVAAAIADRLPSLRLTASAGYSASDAADLLDDWLWNVAGNLLAPIIDGGRRRAEADRAQAVVAERLSRCGEVLLNAMREVEDALVEEQQQVELIRRKTRQYEIAEQTLKQAGSRYRRGLSDYLSVLTALESKQATARALVDARRKLVSFRIQLHRALGGNFPGLDERAELNNGER